MSKFVMLCGLPGAGKSTYCEQYKHNKDWVILSSDEIRAELGDVNDQSKNELVFKLLHQRIKDDLRAGKNVVYDATNLNRKRRIHFLNNELRGIPCEKICLLFATPWEFCLANNFARDRQVPEEVLCRMYKSFEVPCYAEQWDDIQIIWWDYKGMDGFEYDYLRDLEKWCKISHDNPHHTLSIGDHMIAAREWIKDKTNDNKLIISVLMHDCGKNLVRSYIDNKGNVCKTAHYYNHENISAYMSLFYLKEMYKDLKNEEILFISLLINLHMRPYAWEKGHRAKEKDLKLFGQEIINNLELINKADIFAK